MKKSILLFGILVLPILASAATIQKTHTVTFDESDFIFDYTQNGELWDMKLESVGLLPPRSLKGVYGYIETLNSLAKR